jgi:lysophospholipase L1-like esterase
MAAVTVFLSTALGLSCVEVFFRLFYPQPVGASYRGWSNVPVHTPNFDFSNATSEFQMHTHFNSMGLRDREYSRKKPPNTYRILVLGDSITAALEVADSEVYTEILEASLNTPASATHCEVINAGISGFGTGDELRMFDYLGEILEPDLVIVQFSLINDLSENVYCRFYRVEGGRPVELYVPATTLPARIEEFLGRHSHLAQYIRMRVHGTWGEKGELLRHIAEHKERFHAFLYKNAGTAADFETGWQITFTYLDELQRRASRIGARTLLMVRPLDPDIQGVRKSSYPRDLLEAQAKAKGILFLDLTPAFVAKSKGNVHKYRFRNDSHWTPVGHRWAAEGLYQFIEEGVLGPTLEKHVPLP